MADQMDVNVPQIYATSAQFGNLADTAGSIATDLANDLGPINDIAGGDKYAIDLGNNLGPAVDAVNNLLNGVGSGLFGKTQIDLQNTGALYLKANNVSSDLASNLAKP
jgi:hypothetical protein